MRKIWEQILTARSVNIYTHRGPDGDSLGACVGLKRMITDVSPQSDVKVIVRDPLAGKLATCDIARDTISVDRDAEIYVYPDTPIPNMGSPVRHPSIAIDHHGERTSFTDKEYVKIWPSCCGLLLHEFEKLGLVVNSDVAEALLVGAVTDTGYGLYGNQISRENALRDIIALDKISGKYKRNYINSFWGPSIDQEEWLGKIYQHMVLKDKCMFLEVPAELADGKSLGFLRMTLQELTHRISADAFIWTYPREGAHRYSMRSEIYNLLPFAARFGGAGHEGAASFTSAPMPVQEAFVEFSKYLKTAPRIQD